MLSYALRRATASSSAKPSTIFVCAFCQKNSLKHISASRIGHGRHYSTVVGNQAPSPELVRKIRAEIEAQISKKVTPSTKKPKSNTENQKSKAQKPKQKLKGVGVPGRSIAEALKARPEMVVLNANEQELKPIAIKNQPPVASLSHDLDRVLFNPGVYFLQDPRSRVFNFDPYLQNIMPVNEFDFDALSQYITSSRDTKLENLARQMKKKYVGSTSSMTSVLSHFHYLLSSWRPINPGVVSKNFAVPWKTFTALQRSPQAVFLRWKNGVYAIDADKQFDKESVLTLLGKSMEKLLTLAPERFETYRRSNKKTLEPEDRKLSETYHYSTLGDFLMRSQLDAYDPRLPGTGMFDLKTRAVVSIRMDVDNFHIGSGYQIKDRFGEWESFEREYFDMIRAAFLKYSLQVRMGRMDGIFVAFHNTERIFGFQYISLEEMDASIHQDWRSGIGDREFRLSLQLLNNILNKVTNRFPNKSIRIHFETRETQTPLMYIFAEPMEEEAINKIQERTRVDLAQFLKELGDRKAAYLRSLRNEDEDSDVDEVEAADQVEGVSMGEIDAERGIEQVAKQQDATQQEATEQNSPEQESDSEGEGKDAESEELDDQWLKRVGQDKVKGSGQLLAFTLKIRNMVNGKLVLRPDRLKPTDKWEVEYSLEELKDARAWTTYRACQQRRAAWLENRRDVDARGDRSESEINDKYIRNLRELSKKGREYLDRCEKDAPAEKIVWGPSYAAKA